MTMIELVGVMVVLSILTAAVGVSISKNLKRSNRETVVNELQIFATSIADAYYDLGSPSFDTTLPESETDFKRWLTTVQEDYLTVQFDWDTLASTSSGYKIDVASPIDVYEQPYHFWFITSPDVMKYAMVASGGDDGSVAPEGYSSNNYGDDIVLIVRPKS